MSAIKSILLALIAALFLSGCVGTIIEGFREAGNDFDESGANGHHPECHEK